jgi:tetratricopeptide (TPR) repeat protein
MYLIKAQQADNRGETAVAVTNYEMAVQTLTSWDDDLDGFIYLSMARDKFKLGDFQGAAADYDRHLQLNPLLEHCLFKDVPAGIHKESAEAKYKSGDLNGAIGDISKAITLQPKKTENYYWRAGVKWKLQDFAGAEADYEKGLTNAEINAGAYYLRAESKFVFSDIIGASNDLNEGEKLDARNLELYYLRGQISRQTTNYAAALTNFTRCIEMGPQFVRPYFCRAEVERNMKDYERAIADYDRALKARHSTAGTGDFEGIFSGRAYCHLRTFDYEKELADWIELSKLQPSKSVALCQEAQALIYLGRMAEARTNLEQAIASSPDARTYEIAGWRYADLTNYSEALSCSEKASTLDPTNAAAWSSLGYLHENLSQWQPALDDFHKAEELRPDYLYDWYHAYRVRAMLDGVDTAQKELSARLEKIPAAHTNDWLVKVGAYLTGKATGAEMFMAATNSASNRFIQKEQLCEASYYAGIQDLLAGRKNDAKKCFEECIETGEKDFIEYNGARAELCSLEK